jgi:hypothetical protein
MARPRLTFACELDPDRLTAFFASGAVVEVLQALDARVALMLSASPTSGRTGTLWASAHTWHVLGSAAAVASIVRRWRTTR